MNKLKIFANRFRQTFINTKTVYAIVIKNKLIFTLKSCIQAYITIKVLFKEKMWCGYIQDFIFLIK